MRTHNDARRRSPASHPRSTASFRARPSAAPSPKTSRRPVANPGSLRRPVLPIFVVGLLVAVGAPMPSRAQDDDAPADPLALATAALEFRAIGPTIMGGRVADLAVVETDPRVFYVGVASGGVWKTENAGITFEHVFKDEATASVGDVTVAPSNPNVVWVGTGEPQNRQSSPWGAGVYRSTDAGRTWTHLGLENTHHIARIQVHPRDPDVAYVAAVGHLWGANPERGVYRTRDGGETWERVLYVDDDTGAIDLVMDPSDPRTLFAATYQRRRRAWGFNGGGPGSGIHRTTDGGDEWTELTDGLPEGDKGRIGLAVHRGDGNMVFALVEADARGPGQGFGAGRQEGPRRNGVYRSLDRGETWERLSATNNRPMYYSQIWVDPNDPERVYLGGASMYRSSDGGRNFTPDAASGVHLDHHALWIDPADSDHLILGGDGGVSVSWDRSDNWYQLRNLPIAQFYEIGVDMRDPYHVCGGLQDNGSWCAPSDTWSNQGIRARDWYNVGSGDGFFTVMHPANPRLMFAESQGGNLTRVDLATGERARIRPIAKPADDEEAQRLRWNWNTPMLLSAHDDQVVYAGANVVFRSPDLGRTWEEISPDLTHAIDRDTLELMGVLGSEPQMSRNDGQSTYGNLTALAESPLDPAVLYAGSDDGRVHVTRDGGASWQDLTPNLDGLPPHTYVTRIVASHGEPDAVFAAFDGHRNDDFAAYVYASTDFGESWERITDGLPQTSLNALVQHPAAPNLLFAGSEVGVHFSIDAGRSWSRLDGGLPTVPVDDIVVHPRDNDLVVGTHGLGIWIMDDIAPLAELSDDVLASNAHLFSVRRATSYNPYRPQGWTPGIYAAPNPEAGARIRYWLGERMAGGVALEVSDASGTVVRELRGGGRAGLTEVVWDLRLAERAETATEDETSAAEGREGKTTPAASGEGDRVLVSPARMRMEGGAMVVEGPRDPASASPSPQRSPAIPGPRVLPGRYSVTLRAGADTLETSFDVRMDPRTSLSRADLEVRHAAMLDSYRLAHPVQETRRRLRSMGEQLEAAQERVDAAADSVPEELSDELKAFGDALDEAREALQEAAGGATIWRAIEGSTTLPTADQLWTINRSWNDVPPVIESVNALLERLSALHDMLAEADVRPDAGEPVTMPKRGN